MPDAGQAIYEPHIVAFVDLLGFTDLIQNGKAQLALDALKAVQNHKAVLEQPSKIHGIRMSMFSDAIIVSAPISSASPHTANAVLSYCRLLFLEMFERGIVIRGGVTCEQLYHRDPIVFGSGVIHAYRLEQQAIYPRIVVDRKVADIWLNEMIGPTPDGNRFEQQFSCGLDGQLHLRIFTGVGARTDLEPGRRHYLRDYFHKPVMGRIENMLANAHLDDRARQKLTWLLNDVRNDESYFGGISTTSYSTSKPS